MKTRELIEYLSQYDGEIDVMVRDPEETNLIYFIEQDDIQLYQLKIAGAKDKRMVVVIG